MHRMSRTRSWLVSSTAALTLSALAAMVAAPAAQGADAIVGLITKDATNAFFVKMKEGAQAKADELGLVLQAFAGKGAADLEGQVQAVESLIAAGASQIVPETMEASLQLSNYVLRAAGYSGDEANSCIDTIRKLGIWNLETGN